MIDCPCAGEKPANLESDTTPNSTLSPVPLATNNEIFPWNDVRLPSYVRPVRYSITIHPNLTTLDVKGNLYFSSQPALKIYNMENVITSEFSFSVI